MVTPDGKPRPPSRGFLLSSCPKVQGGETSFEGGGVSDHGCRVDARHRFGSVWRRRIASLGLVVSDSFGSDCSISARGLAGLRVNSALWFRLPPPIHNHDLPVLWCRCDGCLRTFGHLIGCVPDPRSSASVFRFQAWPSCASILSVKALRWSSLGQRVRVGTPPWPVLRHAERRVPREARGNHQSSSPAVRFR